MSRDQTTMPNHRGSGGREKPMNTLRLNARARCTRLGPTMIIPRVPEGIGKLNIFRPTDQHYVRKKLGRGWGIGFSQVSGKTLRPLV